MDCLRLWLNAKTPITEDRQGRKLRASRNKGEYRTRIHSRDATYQDRRNGHDDDGNRSIVGERETPYIFEDVETVALWDIFCESSACQLNPGKIQCYPYVKS